MASQKGKRNYKNLWLLSLFILVLGIILTIRLSLIRPLGFALLAIGAAGMVWAIVHLPSDRDENDDLKPPKGFR